MRSIQNVLTKASEESLNEMTKVMFQNEDAKAIAVSHGIIDIILTTLKTVVESADIVAAAKVIRSLCLKSNEKKNMLLTKGCLDITLGNDWFLFLFIPPLTPPP